MDGWIYFVGYVIVAIMVGSWIAANMIIDNRKDQKDKNPEKLTEDQYLAVFFGGVFWPLPLPVLIGRLIVGMMAPNKSQSQKCILCGSKNDESAMHCNHCGNMLKGKI